MMSAKNQFGENVAGYEIRVLNEREIRAASGIMFLFALISLFVIIHSGDFRMAKIVVFGFLTDFVIRLFVHPRYAPMLLIGRFFVRNQRPEYVGAVQKRFAWMIGLILAITMTVFMLVFNRYSFVTGWSCLLCLLFLFLETAFGICLGCILYKWIKKDPLQYCPGEVCEINERAEIQKATANQKLIAIVFILLIAALIFWMPGFLSEQPEALWMDK